ncbi:toprim domain-containing protein [Dactylosporangium sp. AC04546]|uniref:toprim domain-containing protein n=1 Tax=Dactylosporangium sp. AC04546 TaxID=2862460 RepID=UPI001EDF28E7|nr:toprim domain-containing protein [Dactylosporangium sp. AC04546]WVK80442.1 toprim domain-containing protein [Dactylosporangium sp. AC04546]
MTDPERLYAANAAAARFYAERLAPSPKAAAYMESHGISEAAGPGGLWQLGYAPGRWTELATHLRGIGFTAAEVTAAGLGFVHGKSGHLLDRFRDRIMFPITDRENRVIAFTARDLSGRAEARWLNSPETAIYHKRLVLYGLGQQLAHPPGADPEPVVFVVEGAADVVAMHRMAAAHATIPETHPVYVVAPCGTRLTREQLDLLQEALPTAHLILAFDGDDAGRRAVDRAYPIAAKWPGKVSGARLPRGKDPAAMLADMAPLWAMSEIVGRVQPLAQIQLTNTIKRLFAAGHITNPAEYAGDRITAYQAIAELFIDAPHASREMAEAAADLLGVPATDVTSGVVEAWDARNATSSGTDPPPVLPEPSYQRPRLDERRVTASASARSAAQGGVETTAIATRHNDATGVTVWALADGLGHHAESAVAASMAADIAVAVAVHSAPAAGLHAARAAINSHYEGVHESQTGDASLIVVAAYPAPERRHGVRFELAWAGDCRTYTISGGRLAQVTVDHTIARQRRDAGEPARPGGIANLLLTSSVRAGDISVCPLEHGPLLVCNRSVHRAVPETTLALELSGLIDVATTADRLLTVAGGRNAAVLLLHATAAPPALTTATGPGRPAMPVATGPAAALAKSSFANATTPQAHAGPTPHGLSGARSRPPRHP